MNKYLLLLFIALQGGLLYGQQDSVDTKHPLSITLDLMSRYVWRGTDYGGSPSIQPGISYSLAGFTFGTWGAYTTNNPGVQEVDLFLSYSIKNMFSLTVTDYFFPDEGSNYNYFEYGEIRTGHVLEGSLSFDGTDKLPLSIFVATNFYGADAQRLNADSTSAGIQYSTYAEAAYTFKYFNVFMGFNLTYPDTERGEIGYYGTSIGVINLGLTASKKIRITDKFSLPVTASIITNPQAEKIYLVAGFSF